MCFSFESSIIAWVIAFCISLYLFNRNRKYDRWNALFIFTFTLIQLIEAGLWSNKNSNLDSTYIALIILVLSLQPLAQTYGGWLYTRNNILKMLLYIYIAIVIYSLIRIGDKNNEMYSTVGKNGHLVWNVKNKGKNVPILGNSIVGILYLFGLFFPLLYQNPYNGIPLLLVGILTAFYSFSRSSTKEFGSLWCFTAVIYSVIALIN